MGLISSIFGSSSGNQNSTNPGKTSPVNQALIEMQETIEGHIEAVIESFGKYDRAFEDKVMDASNGRRIKELATEYENNVVETAKTKEANIETELEKLESKHSDAKEHNQISTAATHAASNNIRVAEKVLDELEQETGNQRNAMADVIEKVEAGDLENARGEFLKVLRADEERESKFEAQLESNWNSQYR